MHAKWHADVAFGTGRCHCSHRETYNNLVVFALFGKLTYTTRKTIMRNTKNNYAQHGKQLCYNAQQGLLHFDSIGHSGAVIISTKHETGRTHTEDGGTARHGTGGCQRDVGGYGKICRSTRCHQHAEWLLRQQGVETGLRSRRVGKAACYPQAWHTVARRHLEHARRRQGTE